MNHHEMLRKFDEELQDIHGDLKQAHNISEIHLCGKELHKLTSNVSFKKLVHELGHPGKHLYELIEKAEENINKSSRVSDARKCLVLLESVQHAVREQIHKLEHSNSRKHH